MHHYVQSSRTRCRVDRPSQSRNNPCSLFLVSCIDLPDRFVTRSETPTHARVFCQERRCRRLSYGVSGKAGVNVFDVLQAEQVWDTRSTPIHVEFRIDYQGAAERSIGFKGMMYKLQGPQPAIAGIPYVEALRVLHAQSMCHHIRVARFTKTATHTRINQQIYVRESTSSFRQAFRDGLCKQLDWRLVGQAPPSILDTRILQQLTDAMKRSGTFEIALKGLLALSRDHFQDIFIAYDSARKDGRDSFDSHYQWSPRIIGQDANDARMAIFISTRTAALPRRVLDRTAALLEGRLPRAVHRFGSCRTLVPAKTTPGVVMRYLISSPLPTITPSKRSSVNRPKRPGGGISKIADPVQSSGFTT
jgi:hypothetical protein